MSARDALTSTLLDRPQCRGEWRSVVVTVAADTVASRVVHASDIDAADFGAVGNVASETAAGVRGTNEGTPAG